ncbi:bifunctional proline dehydrogenase/L-glutamate gamma-semialdehyde dehydrogenase PutA [Novosphingobium sp. FKTRR1]|uniref:bifunctional proline dehydrogenase/L-glutamate gamma-semialdehyde dehydrogenase PutA n=1 Tax=Novosphingobium sp. FKTRR1 TaxID=2879118 RepID=UPI001CF0302A|nr:bifunctional proline dehydrogenase/L-glutamate gamma-semialdehyde dehydrogenase PutA [Novosphingobium sp. FKTRR1]
MTAPALPLPAPFATFLPPLPTRSALRHAITAATRRSEPDCMAPLLAEATLPPALQAQVRATATALVEGLRAKPGQSGVAALMQEFALSSEEGVALMCLAEALLRIPDNATRDALIRDKIGGGDWAAHLGGGNHGWSQGLFVNAATWGLVIGGHIAAPGDQPGLWGALHRIVARCGEPLVRAGVHQAIRLMGGQFVTGETIDEALSRSRPAEAKGFGYSYDMLGEAALTAADADRYHRAYIDAINAIGRASAGRGVIGGPGVSIKLSALHPRYARAQTERVMTELLPRVQGLCELAKRHDIGLSIDAEEADRLELSLDVFEALATDPELAGWQGLGLVVQAYGKRCPMVLDWVIDLARRSRRRIMLRLVKGAYWDAEIKRAQVEGLTDYPVYTRKVHTDVAYIACARRLLAARDAVFPQFATHNAQTLASIYQLAGPDFTPGDYEFQCLQGMGEPLYEQVVGPLQRPCRIYAPVGTHETLLAYLVRRLLENGANSSFVNRITDPAVPVAELVADPVEIAAPFAGSGHDRIPLPGAILGARTNSAGVDLADQTVLETLGAALIASTAQRHHAGHAGDGKAVRNPARLTDIVGTVADAAPAAIEDAVARAVGAAPLWAATPAAARAEALRRAADAMEAAMPDLIALAIREAGKSAANAVSEVREAIDFLRYYADGAEALDSDALPLGPVACISPWNFPLAIFTGQVAAALAAGNVVLAKPAEETPLMAAAAVELLRKAGISQDVLQLLPGDGRTGAALVAHPAICGVMFTGSTEVARAIQRTLSRRLSPWGAPVPLIAETGGQNVMMVDSSALPEQVVVDVVTSAFDSAGQRCSALRVLALQDDIADKVITMLKGAMAELVVGDPARLATDIGPVITAEAQERIEAHVAAMAARGATVHRLPLGHATRDGTFVAPTLIEIASLDELNGEVFGPVLHVLRWRREDRDALVDAVNSTGYGLTFGLHTRLDETVAQITARVRAGNIYVNRNMIGAVVGVQPFGGSGLSGTGPKAGGPLYLARLVRNADPALPMLDAPVELPGPVGESNRYAIHPRGTVLLLPETAQGLARQLAAVRVTGNARVAVAAPERLEALRIGDHAELRVVTAIPADEHFAAALVEAEGPALLAAQQAIAALPGPIVPVLTAPWPTMLLVEEQVTSINTTAAGGNASLMAMA